MKEVAAEAGVEVAGAEAPLADVGTLALPRETVLLGEEAALVDVLNPLLVVDALASVAFGVLNVVGQLKSNRALVESLSVIANFILFSAFESRMLYQNAVVCPKSLRHPTSCQ